MIVVNGTVIKNEKEACFNNSTIKICHFCLDIYTSMRECMQTCEKLDKSRGPNIRNIDEMNVALQKNAETVYIPGTATLFPNAITESIWLSITDEKEEGNWVDWYTGESVDLSDGLSGQLGKVILSI